MRAHFDGRLFISKSLPYFLEFASPEVTKGSGLAFLAERLGFTAAETVAFGDGENDVELLEWAGYGVAVENATDRVLAIADLVCPPVDRGGRGAGDRGIPGSLGHLAAASDPEHHRSVRWGRRREEYEDVIGTLAPFLMRMNAKLDEILDLLGGEDDEAESDP